jgi:hypothetical protein
MAVLETYELPFASVPVTYTTLVLYTVPAEVVEDSEVEVDKSDEVGSEEVGWLEVEGMVDVGEVVVGVVDVGWVVIADETAEVEIGVVTGMDEEEDVGELEVEAEVTGRVDDTGTDVTGWEEVGTVAEASSEVAGLVAGVVDVAVVGIEEELGAVADSTVDTKVVA